MSKFRGFVLVASMFVVVLLGVSVFAQETTSGLQGTVKDAQGAVISRAAVEVSSPALLGAKKAHTDAAGTYRFSNLPPGLYTLVTTAEGFATTRQTGIELLVGKLPTLNVELKIGSTEQTIEVSSDAALVDVVQSKVQTSITQEAITAEPTGRSFQSLIQFAPGARTEPLQSGNLKDNGFQIDGASNSENAYLVEGQETASIQDGHSAANIPMEFIQEVQVKSSGFEAEYGGALGGVVNVIQKRGGHAWHGELFTHFNSDSLDSGPNEQLRKNPKVAFDPVSRTDAPSQTYTPKQDHYTTIIPGFTVGGPILKDRLSVFLAFAPNFANLTRTVNFIKAGPTQIRQTDNTYYSNARVDYTLSQRIRLYGAWTYQYERVQGPTTYPTNAMPNPDDKGGLYNTSSANDPSAYGYQLGTLYPNVIYNFGGDVTLSPNLVASTRYGYFYQDTESRGTPTGIRYYARDTNYPYPVGSVGGTSSTKALDGSVLPAQFQTGAGWFNMGDNTSTSFDKWKHYSFNQDLSYFKRALGAHNFKFGYALTKGSNDVLTGYNSADVYVAYNQSYAPGGSIGGANCDAIVASNTLLYGAAAGKKGCQGNWGTVNLRELGTTGKVGGTNHALYAQDAWTIGKRLTLNVGLRLDKEYLPSYNPLFGGISFGWGDKLAPRLGAAFDVLGNGKVKAYASLGYFYDIMKYNLPRGSFGGDYWHDCVYALDVADFTTLQPKRDASGHYCPIGGGSTPANGALAGTRFIENFDYRQPANDPNQLGGNSKTGLIDPNLKPMKQHEMVIGADWAITPMVGLEARYSRKRLDRTIEDTGVILPGGEQYYISNPGEGANKSVPADICAGCPANPKAFRRYDGVEFRLTRRSGHGWGGQLSYTYSKLTGNYSGLTSTDISDGGAGRNGANADRAFDESFMQFDAHGRVIDGPLATDRPNTFKADAFYTVKWLHQETQFGVFQQLYQGTPLSSYTSVWGAPVFVEGRGKFVDVTRDPVTGNWIAGSISSRRTPMYPQTDLRVTQNFHVSKTNENLLLSFSGTMNNLFNQHAAVLVNQNLTRTGHIDPDPIAGSPDYLTLETKGYNYINEANHPTSPSHSPDILNSLYGQAYGWEQPRTIRVQVAVHF